MDIEDYAEDVRTLIHEAAGNRRVTFHIQKLVDRRLVEVASLEVPADLSSVTDYVPGTEGFADKLVVIVAALDLDEAVQQGVLPRYPAQPDVMSIKENNEPIEESTVTKIFYDTLGASRASFGYVIGP